MGAAFKSNRMDLIGHKEIKFRCVLLCSIIPLSTKAIAPYILTQFQQYKSTICECIAIFMELKYPIHLYIPLSLESSYVIKKLLVNTVCFF